jgi:LuxR family maltose regulon positive regulatory protein
MLAVGETRQRRESLGWAHYLLSCVAYQRNDLETADTHAQAMFDLRYVSRPMAYVQSVFVRASVYQARGLPEQARAALDLAFDFIHETQSNGLLPIVRAFQAELAARQGDLDMASQWAATFGPQIPLTAMPYFSAPQLTLPKILLAQNTPASLKQAEATLSGLYDFVTATHNTYFTIEVLALQALHFHARGNSHDALISLQQAVNLAHPGGILRIFVDLGPTLAELLRQRDRSRSNDAVLQLR